ncbi:hypothetical protein AQJ64_22770 [Streptomyces griseoruber]|uniref:Uncharacterized protein n=1 Tax=Streptomyces griseoruber TaxID=1943 RepID=A0A117RB79_9ACTN|nr:hypothetical protein AQJ64_22770 [Streptomyces griseoruber]
MHGVVAGVQEHPAPQIGDRVRLPLGDTDETAARPDVREFLLGHLVPDARGQDRQHGEREQGLEGAGGRQLAVRVRGGEHLAAPGVGHQPGQRREVGDLGGTAAGSDLRTGTEEERRLRGVRPFRRPRPHRRGAGAGSGRGGGRGGPEGQGTCRTEDTGRQSDPRRESDLHMINVGIREAFPVLPVPCAGQ